MVHRAENTRENSVMLILTPPRNLTEGEWRQIFSVFGDHPIAFALVKLWKANNRPQRASDLFPEHLVNQYGNEYINNYLRRAEVPFRLTRIGSWMGETNRRRRWLAVVPWPPEDEQNSQVGANA